jgi:hypothetical protein
MSLERRQTCRLSATLGTLSKRLEVKSLNGRARSSLDPRTSWNFTAQEVRMEKSASESGKERKNITLSKEGRKYSILSNEYGRLRARGRHATSSPRSTLTIRGSDLEVVADVWRAHGDAQRLHLRSIRTRQKTGLLTRRRSVKAQGRIEKEKSGLAIPHLEPIMKLLLFHRPNAMSESLFSSEESLTSLDQTKQVV